MLSASHVSAVQELNCLLNLLSSLRKQLQLDNGNSFCLQVQCCAELERNQLRINYHLTFVQLNMHLWS